MCKLALTDSVEEVGSLDSLERMTIAEAIALFRTHGNQPRQTDLQAFFTNCQILIVLPIHVTHPESKGVDAAAAAAAAAAANDGDDDALHMPYRTALYIPSHKVATIRRQKDLGSKRSTLQRSTIPQYRGPIPRIYLYGNTIQGHCTVSPCLNFIPQVDTMPQKKATLHQNSIAKLYTATL